MRIALIGCGNLGSALLRGFLQTSKHDIIVCDSDDDKLAALLSAYKVEISASVSQAVKDADVVVCAVKPKQIAGVLTAARHTMEAKKEPPLLISVAAGVTTEMLRQAIGEKVRIVRVMPNVACLIAKGVSGIYGANENDVSLADELFQSVGETFLCGQESELNVVTALGAGGPAFIFVAIEALADGGVRMGLTREQALRMAASMTMGAAALMLETGQHPAQLKDMVASPGGTTIAGLHILEKSGFRGALISAVEASTKRAAE